MDIDPGRHTDPSGTWRGYALAGAALLCSLLLVLLYWRSAQQRELGVARAAFVIEAEEITDRLRQRLGSYALVTRGAVALFASVARPSALQWRDYAAGVQDSDKATPMVGMGYAAWVASDGLRTLQADAAAAGQDSFEVRPAGARDHYGPVTYLEPRTPANIAAIGYDMYADPARRLAMDDARDNGRPRLSAPLRLLQDRPGDKPGLLLYAPVYRQGVVPTTPGARRGALGGWVYLPLHASDLARSALGTRRDVDMVLTDVTGGGDVLLYADDRASGGSRDATFRHATTIDAFGRQWRVAFAGDRQAAAALKATELRTTLVVGVLASLLLFGIAMALARTESRARRMAARMSESYRRSELRFRNAMAYSAIGKGLLDHAGRVVEANPALHAILGRSPTELIGTPFSAHVGDGDGAGLVTGEMEALAEGVHRTTRTFVRADGALRSAQLTFAPIPGDVGQDITRLVQVEDITERLLGQARIEALNRTLEARVAARTQELTDVNRELESFAYNVSHDLRAPLRAIDGFTRLLGERYADVIDEAGRDYLARVRNAATRMGELIEAMLKMSRLGRAELHRGPVDIGKLAMEAIADLRAGQPGRAVDVHIAPGLRASGDTALVRNLLQNLLGNAWKFTGRTATAIIEVGALDAEGWTAVSETPLPDGQQAFFIRDNGAGFAPEHGDKLFRPFQRLHGVEEFAGHGIGLASVKRIVERHGGSIVAQGQTGQGATFAFTLPADDPAV